MGDQRSGWIVATFLLMLFGLFEASSFAQEASSAAAKPAARRGPFINAAWPFRPKPAKSVQVNDPFQHYGAESQQQLARQLSVAAEPAPAAGVMALPPSSLPPGAAQAPGAPIPANTQAAAIPPSRPYPWPAPVDSRRPPAAIDIPPDVWGVPAAAPAASQTLPAPLPPELPATNPAPISPIWPSPQKTAATLAGPQSANNMSHSSASASAIDTSAPMSGGTDLTSATTPMASQANLASTPGLPGALVPPSVPAISVMTPDLGTRVLAIVGNQTILANDLLTGIDERIAAVGKEAPADVVNAELDEMFQKMLPKAIEYKLLYIEFLRMVPPEGVGGMEEQAGKHFEETELPKYMKEFQISTLAELDAKMRGMGTSLMRVKRTHFEMEVARQILPRIMKFDPEVSHEERLEYYRRHIADYLQPARVRWERLSANLDRTPSRQDAYRAIVAMGNEVIGGAPLGDVAKRSSHCPMASSGGAYDWTRLGSLASKPIDQALSTIEPGKLSKIIEDEQGFHIVRVIERKDASYRTFEEMQDEIMEKVREERFQEKMKATLERMHKETEIWTVYDDVPGGSPEGGTPTKSGPHPWVQAAIPNVG